MTKVEEGLYFDFNPNRVKFDRVGQAAELGFNGSIPDLRYSPPWPWVLAICISLAIWATCACAVWVLIR
jgi:hypothetical protein